MLRELAGAVHERRITPRELVQAALDRIDALNPDLNAVIARRDEEALAEADRSSGEGMLAGIPVLVKELNEVAGMRSTRGGSPLHRDDPPAARDALVVRRLREAGAIVVGLTNSPSFGHTAVTTNPLFGPTRNPWNPQRSPGGSSGGSAAALATGMIPVATTTDGGGSVRIPASLCGLVGYKPTMGAVGRAGARAWMTFSSNGATNATVADVLHEAAVIIGPGVGDLQAAPAPAAGMALDRPGRVYACRTLRAGVDPGVEAAFEQTCGVLADQIGVPVEPIESPFGDDVLLTWFVIGAVELAQSLAWARDRWDEQEPMLRFILETGVGTSTFDYVAGQRRRYELCGVLDELLGDDGVLVTPTVNTRSWPAEGPMSDTAGDVVGDPSVTVNTPDFNMTGHPAVSVPMGIDADGVPMGLQVVAPRWRDGLALWVAGALEQAQPWPGRPPGYEPFPVS